MAKNRCPAMIAARQKAADKPERHTRVAKTHAPVLVCLRPSLVLFNGCSSTKVDDRSGIHASLMKTGF